MESSDALILGGGFSGLACATALAQSGMRVTLLEKKPHLGGRAYSFRDPRTGETVDNGQHLFMGCYRHTRLFLRRIGAEHLLDFPGRVELHYADAEGRRDLLRLPWWAPAPVHLALGVAGLRGLSWTDKAALWGLDRAVRRMNGASSTRSLDRQTVREWLNALGQPARLQERLFDPIVIGALNELPERASALGFAQVLREVFYRQRENSMLGFARVGLSELYVEQARVFIEGRGGRVLLNRKAARLVEEGGEVREVVMESGERFVARTVVSSLPPWQLRRLERSPALSGDWISWN
ncbi:MAG: FAD-dependent oxidoreductase, partial [Elusimicrobia bacterium]|nr:FAD-dependent oxidoreductase [Elusimicrobiota bacterium]